MLAIMARSFRSEWNGNRAEESREIKNSFAFAPLQAVFDCRQCCEL